LRLDPRTASKFAAGSHDAPAGGDAFPVQIGPSPTDMSVVFPEGKGHAHSSRPNEAGDEFSARVPETEKSPKASSRATPRRANDVETVDLTLDDSPDPKPNGNDGTVQPSLDSGAVPAVIGTGVAGVPAVTGTGVAGVPAVTSPDPVSTDELGAPTVRNDSVVKNRRCPESLLPMMHLRPADLDLTDTERSLLKPLPCDFAFAVLGPVAKTTELCETYPETAPVRFVRKMQSVVGRWGFVLEVRAGTCLRVPNPGTLFADCPPVITVYYIHHKCTVLPKLMTVCAYIAQYILLVHSRLTLFFSENRVCVSFLSFDQETGETRKDVVPA